MRSDIGTAFRPVCALLNAPGAAGMPNMQRGTHLLLVPMPHERGGRIYCPGGHDTWRVSAAFRKAPGPDAAT